MPFGECTITLQDVAYQLGLSIDGQPVSGCLTDFENLMEHGRPAWVWFRELFEELPPQNKLFADKNANRVHLRWLPYLASLDELGRYSWGSAALAWLPARFYGFGFSLASRWATYLPRNDAMGQRVMSARLMLDRLRVHDFVWEPYFSTEVAAIIHPEILVDQHRVETDGSLDIIRSGISIGRTGFIQSYRLSEPLTPVHQLSTWTGGAMWPIDSYP
ncbi:uncharacterized protein DS421_1g20130 [Arachis hypogaea]|nr:uncharacterized protein DS421_1g20130 [Arachis hypogaea]